MRSVTASLLSEVASGQSHTAGHAGVGLSSSLVVLVLAAVVGVGYWVSLRRHPYVRCSRCHGRGRAWGKIFTRSYALCGGCGGTGHSARWGTRLLPAAYRPRVPRGPGR